MGGKSKRRGRQWADFCGAFGFWPFGKFRYRHFVALYLNVGRVRLQRAWAAKQGNDLSRSLATIPWAWFDAVGLTIDEGVALAFEVNARRAEAKAASRRR